MATTTTSAEIPSVQLGLRLFTVADLAAMPEQLPSGPVSFELHKGRLVSMSPPGAGHGNIQARWGAELWFQGEAKKLGLAYAEVGIVLARNPDHVVSPDAAFVKNHSLPVKVSSEGFLETIPELVVEIRSKNDSTKQIAEKVADYLQAGVQLVWIVDSTAQAVTEHRGNLQPKVLGVADTLQCEDIIPNFRLSIAELFRE